MELINFAAWIEQQKALTSTSVDTANDQIIIGKKVNDKRDGSQYQAFAMSIEEFAKLAVDGYATIQEESVSLPARTVMNFVGAGVTVTDAGGKTVVTIPGDTTKKLITNVSQTGADPIVFRNKDGDPIPFENTLGETPSLLRNAAGQYYIDTVAPIFGKNNVHFSGNVTGTGAGTAAMTIVSLTTGLPIGYVTLYNANTDTRLILESRDLTGTLVELSTLIGSNPFSLPEIKVYL